MQTNAFYNFTTRDTHLYDRLGAGMRRAETSRCTGECKDIATGCESRRHVTSESGYLTTASLRDDPKSRLKERDCLIVRLVAATVRATSNPEFATGICAELPTKAMAAARSLSKHAKLALR